MTSAHQQVLDIPFGEEKGAVVGFNVIGHVGGNLGVGVATRQVIDLLMRKGHLVAAFDVDRTTWQERDRSYDHLLVDRSEELPHSINLFVLGLGGIDVALEQVSPRLFDTCYFNAIICFWELPALPAARAVQLDNFDVVIAASDFMRHVFLQTLTRATVVHATLPTATPCPVPFHRDSLGIPASATVFGFNFDPMSDIERKNPRAVLSAFQLGVGNTGAWLVLRINNAYGKDGALRPPIAALQLAVREQPRVVLVTRPMSHAEVMGLYLAFDVYISLHRAEGLGLGMAEAMTLGIPVVATGWSGNLTFMRHTNAWLVGYRLIPVRATLDAYQHQALVGDARWAEPDIDHAAALMRLMETDGTLRGALGRAALASMKVFNAIANEGAFIDDLLALKERRLVLRAAGYQLAADAGPQQQGPHSVSRWRRVKAGVLMLGRRVLRTTTKAPQAKNELVAPSVKRRSR